MGLKILVADDDPHIRDVIDFALQKAGHRTVMVKDGDEALRSFAADAPDLIVLDVGMPEIDGLEVCRRVRRSSDVPILFLSARDEEIDRILGLEIGGDDYVTKPFSPRELVARIGVITRRAAKTADAGSLHRTGRLSKGDVKLDRDRHEVSIAGRPVLLTATEFTMIAAFLERPDQVIDRDRLMTVSYRDNIHVSDRTIDSHIRNIRAKFAAAGCDSLIETVHGVGFRLGACLKRTGASAGSAP